MTYPRVMGSVPLLFIVIVFLCGIQTCMLRFVFILAEAIKASG